MNFDRAINLASFAEHTAQSDMCVQRLFVDRQGFRKSIDSVLLLTVE